MKKKPPVKLSGLLGGTQNPASPPPKPHSPDLVFSFPTAASEKKISQQQVIVSNSVMGIPLDAIVRSPYQNRAPVSAERVEALARELKKHGLNNPVVVRPLDNGRYELVVGETRVNAYRLNGETTIPAFVRPMPDNESAKRLVLDNFHHGDLTDYEIYKGLLTLRDTLKNEGKSGSLSEIAEMTPWTKTHVFRFMSFSKLPASALALLEEGASASIGAKAASDLAKIIESNPNAQDSVVDAVKAILSGDMDQGSAAAWVEQSSTAENNPVKADNPMELQPLEKSKKSVRAVTVADGRLACTIEKTPKGFLLKGAKGISLQSIEEELAEWLAIKLA